MLMRGLDARTRTRTGWPASRSAAAMADPTNPLAPVTRTGPGASDPDGMKIETSEMGVVRNSARIVSPRRVGFIRKMDTDFGPLHCPAGRPGQTCKWRAGIGRRLSRNGPLVWTG